MFFADSERALIKENIHALEKGCFSFGDHNKNLVFN